MFTQLHREIQLVKERLLALGADIERSISETERCLIDLDPSRGKTVIAYDKTIDQHEVDIEEECLKIMALHQPVAADLRGVVAILKINNDLERMGDLCKNICKYVVEITKRSPVEIPRDFGPMFAETRRMVRESLDSLVNRDVELARDVILNDDVVDQFNAQIIEEIRSQMHATPEHIDQYIYLISASRCLERIADYATNIAEDTAYAVNGQIVRHADIEEAVRESTANGEH